MSQQHQMAMQGIGVGGPVAAPANAGTPTHGAAGFSPQESIKKLNTAIYDYLLCNEQYDAARAIKNCLLIETADSIKQSPGQRQNQPNGVDGGMDVDTKENIGIARRPDDLPAPKAMSSEEGSFLQDWWCQFWEIYLGNRSKGKQTTLSYVGTQRTMQKNRNAIMGGADPNAAQRAYMNNGAAMNDLRQAAIKNQMTPAQQAHMQQATMKMRQAQGNQMQGAQMERQGSQMDVNGPRSGSPNTGGDNPSSPKRQRLDGGGNMQQINQARPGQPGQLQGGNQSVEVYSAAIQQQMQAAMQRTNSNTNKGPIPNAAMGPGGAQPSPMNQQGLDGTSSEFYQNRMGNMPPQSGAAIATGQQANGNHALQDYQMQLMLLEQQNKKRLLMARQEQDSIAHPTGVPGGPNGGQFAPGMSPQGSRAGDPSPNPNDMQRGTPNFKKAGMSPNGDMTGRGSPNPGMMDPNMNPAMRPQMVMGPNGQPVMRPPSSHPQMTQQQMEMMRNSQINMANGNWQGGPPGPVMAGQQPPQQGGVPGQQPNMTPRQGNMAPPPAPPTGQTGTQPSSPSTQPAPPTPNQNAKTKAPAKKAAEKKNANSKKGAAAAAAAEESQAPPTPTPPPPVTPNNPNPAAFNQNKNLQMPNGQPVPNQQNPNANNQQQPGAQPGQPNFGNMDAPFGQMDEASFQIGDFSNLDGGDVLDNFDFDSFLNNDEGIPGFDANFAFDGDAELTLGQ